jgi:hypothetical protein
MTKPDTYGAAMRLIKKITDDDYRQAAIEALIVHILRTGDAIATRGDGMTRAEFFVWLNSHRNLAELLERSDAISELLSEGLGLPVYDGGDEITTIDVTALGKTYLPPMLPRGQA